MKIWTLIVEPSLKGQGTRFIKKFRRFRLAISPEQLDGGPCLNTENWFHRLCDQTAKLKQTPETGKIQRRKLGTWIIRKHIKIYPGEKCYKNYQNLQKFDLSVLTAVWAIARGLCFSGEIKGLGGGGQFAALRLTPTAGISAVTLELFLGAAIAWVGCVCAVCLVLPLLLEPGGRGYSLLREMLWRFLFSPLVWRNRDLKSSLKIF